MRGLGRHLRQVRDAQRLAGVAQPAQLAADDFGHAAADAGIDLVEDQRGHTGTAGRDHLDGQADARQLTARGHPIERACTLAGVGGDQELDVIGAGLADAIAGLGAYTHAELALGHAQRLNDVGDRGAECLGRCYAGLAQRIRGLAVGDYLCLLVVLEHGQLLAGAFKLGQLAA